MKTISQLLFGTILFLFHCNCNAQILAYFSVQGPTCYGANNGQICKDSINGGIAPYIIEIISTSNYFYNPNSQCFTNCHTGNYAIKITDSMGLTDTTIVTVPPSLVPQLHLNFEITRPHCNTADGSICVHPTGGSGFYELEWSVGPEYSHVPMLDSCLVNLPAVQHQIVLHDQNTICSKAHSFPMQVEGLLNIDSVQNSSCMDTMCNGAISFSMFGTPPYSFEWYGPNYYGPSSLFSTSENPGNLCEGTYLLEVTDATGCVETEAAHISLFADGLLCGTGIIGICSLLAEYGCTNSCTPYDLDNDGGVGISDLMLLIALLE